MIRATLSLKGFAPILDSRHPVQPFSSKFWVASSRYPVSWRLCFSWPGYCT